MAGEVGDSVHDVASPTAPAYRFSEKQTIPLSISHNCRRLRLRITEVNRDFGPESVSKAEICGLPRNRPFGRPLLSHQDAAGIVLTLERVAAKAIAWRLLSK